MAAKRDDFLKPLLELMQRHNDSLEKKVEDNTKLTQKALEEAQHAHKQAKITNGRVNQTEKQIKSLEAKLETKKTWAAYVVTLPPKVLYLLAVSCVILLLIVANKLKVDLSGLFNA